MWLGDVSVAVESALICVTLDCAESASENLPMKARSQELRNHLGNFYMDPISEMLNSLKTAAKARKKAVAVPHSNIKFEIAKVLEKQGLIRNVVKAGKKVVKNIQMEIIYQEGQPKFSEVKRISKPSRRIYIKSDEIRSVRQGHGFGIISTPKGVLTDKEAREAKVGGEVLVKVW